MAYDFSDSEIVKMVKMNHRPIELPARNSASVTAEVEPIQLVVVCVIDHEPWPCSAVTQLREHEGKDVKGRLATGRGTAAVTAKEALEFRRAQGKIIG